MEQASYAITALCAEVCREGVEPLERREWTELVRRLRRQGLDPGALEDFAPEDYVRLLGLDGVQEERLARLLGRGNRLREELERWEDRGVRTVTWADGGYPRPLRDTLDALAPPVLYAAGDLDLGARPAVGYVGSRSIPPEDAGFTGRTVDKTCARGYGVVSGGAVGADQAAQGAALRQGRGVVSYLCDSLAKTLRRPGVWREVEEGRLLLLSAVGPDAPFTTAAALTRNRFIYAHAAATVVIRADYGRGGTWSGATDALRHRWCPVLCWDRPDYPGNAGLLARGAIPIGEDWDGDVDALEAGAAPDPDQLGLFE